MAAARRAGAPVAGSEADVAANQLLRGLERGEKLSERLRRLLADRLGQAPPLSDAARSAAGWAGASPTERGEALCDLLLLADAIPAPRTERPRTVPRLKSAK